MFQCKAPAGLDFSETLSRYGADFSIDENETFDYMSLFYFGLDYMFVREILAQTYFLTNLHSKMKLIQFM